MDKIYAMKLHEEIQLGKEVSQFAAILRVPGGRVYTFYTEEAGITSTFVPFNNEFQI